ncbi:MFS transporter [Paraburkholderia hospita]|uniref:MFS transporter n=1 Tax=Paraburkholderia hospita TaxID=169430 RepID=A0AAN1JL50_9BURK|nr:MFS transporter [Paraburkholderia hospita]AUT74912.1 MFS transporter [Paraburkholderia hospita]EIM94941.1 major facilitator superfamily protein [Paraburkholderia hospita]OUL77529.1 MFS transporter [Paraburkholderia hospita]OUL91935.1 MFS transporter [Paraburkholderia hospita]SEH69892.1 MFS transporter, MHS family, metabolite:H+ symporter [Paraburkholderia hospita]
MKHQPTIAAAEGGIASNASTTRNEVTTADLYRAAWAASLGSALEYYDFALYNLASALIFGPLFFPSSDPAMGLIASFGAYFLGFAIRPVGGIVFGTLGDRYGRKFVLMATILLMGIASTLIGLLPTYASAGIWAPILLVGCRLLQGLGAGAEQAGAAVLMAEYAPAKRRGYFAALPFMGVLLGTVMAAAIYFALVRVEDISQSWLWRVPFLLSVVIIAVAIWIRLKLKESPSFTKLEARQQVNDSPLKHLIRHSTPTLLKVIGMRMAENGGSSIYQSLAISYMVTATGLKGPIGPIALLLAGVSGAVIIPMTGMLSDRFGRVPVYRAFALYQLLLAYPTWWVLSQGNAAASIAMLCVALAGVWGMFATQGALLPELFGAQHRYAGVAVGREVSAVIAGGVAPLIGASIIAWATAHWGGAEGRVMAWIPLATYVAILSLIGVVTTFYTPETRGRDLDDLRDAAEDPVALSGERAVRPS